MLSRLIRSRVVSAESGSDCSHLRNGDFAFTIRIHRLSMFCPFSRGNERDCI